MPCPKCEEEEEKKSTQKWKERLQAIEQSIEELKRMPYAQYLKTEHWNQVRKEALRRAKYRCQLCNESTALHVHHNTYERRGQELPSDVIAICRSCHEKQHGYVVGEDV